MTAISELEFLRSENLKLRNYISLIQAEIELKQRVYEIKNNFSNSDDSDHIVSPIMSRISRIESEKSILQQELNLL